MPFARPPWLLLGFVGFLVVMPVAMLVLGSFSADRIPGNFSLDRLTLANYAAAYGSPLTYRVLGNTTIYTVATVALGLAMAAFFAWLVARTDAPGRRIAQVLIPLPLVIPGMLESMVWVLLFSPRIGFVNRAAMGAFGLSDPPFDVYSMAGMISLESIRLVPSGFLLLLPLFLRFDPALEDAAAASGAAPTSVARRITLPLLMPGLLSVVIYQAISVLSSFEVPGIIGLPAQVYVFSTLVYTRTSAAASAGGSDFGTASALAMVYLATCIVGLLLYTRWTRHADRFAVISGKGYRPRAIVLGAWRWPAAAALTSYAFVAFVLPVLVLLWASLTPRILQPGPPALASLTDRNWRALATSDELMRILGNTVFVTVTTATLVVVLAFAIGWVATRTRFPARRALEQLAFISHGVPGVILALALIWFWVQLDLPVYGTPLILVIGLSTGFLAYGSRSVSVSLLQVHRDLEEAAYTSGASTVSTMRDIFVPLLLPALVGLWIWVALHAVRFVTLPLMLQTGPENTVLAAYLWREWEAGEVNLVAAAGLGLIVMLLVVTAVAMRLGQGPRRAAMSG